MITENSKRLGLIFIVGGLVLWLLDLAWLTSAGRDTNQVVLAALGTMTVLLPAIMLFGVVALIIGAAIADHADERQAIENPVDESATVEATAGETAADESAS